MVSMAELYTVKQAGQAYGQWIKVCQLKCLSDSKLSLCGKGVLILLILAQLDFVLQHYQ